MPTWLIPFMLKIIPDILKAPSLQDVIVHQMREATLEVQQSNAVIVAHQFQRHISQAKIDALISWNVLQTANGVTNAN